MVEASNLTIRPASKSSATSNRRAKATPWPSIAAVISTAESLNSTSADATCDRSNPTASAHLSHAGLKWSWSSGRRAIAVGAIGRAWFATSNGDAPESAIFP